MADLLNRKLNTTLLKIFQEIGANSGLSFVIGNKVRINADKKILLEINKKDIIFPLDQIKETFLQNPSLEQDFFVDHNFIAKLIKTLNDNRAIRGLNHIGFCYKVKSQTTEQERLIFLTAKSPWHLYEIPSNDESLWLFIGNTNKWEDPLIELLPVEKTSDPTSKWWLPHIHIALETNLTEDQIVLIVNQVFNGQRKAFKLVVIDSIVYQMRIWLGIVEGINIDIDLSTASVNRKYERKYLMKKLAYKETPDIKA